MATTLLNRPNQNKKTFVGVNKETGELNNTTAIYDNNSILVSKMPTLVQGRSGVENASAKAGKVEDVREYYKFTQDSNASTTSKNSAGRYKIEAGSDKLRTQTTVEMVLRYYEANNKKDFSHIPNIIDDIVNSLLLQAMESNVLANHFVVEPYQQELAAKIAMNMKDIAADIQIDTNKAKALSRGYVQIDKDEQNQQAKADARDLYNAVSITANSNNGISVNDKPDKVLDTVSSTSFELSSGKVIRSFLKINQLSQDGNFNGEFSAVFLKKQGFSTQYYAIPVKSNLNDLIHGKLEIDKSPNLGKNGEDYNRFNSLSDKDKASLEEIFSTWANRFARIIDEQKKALLQEFSSLPRFKEELVEEELEKEDFARYKSKQPPLEGSEREEFAKKISDSLKAQANITFNEKLATLPELVGKTISFKSTIQMGGLLAKEFTDSVTRGSGANFQNVQVAKCLKFMPREALDEHIKNYSSMVVFLETKGERGSLNPDVEKKENLKIKDEEVKPNSVSTIAD